MSAWVCPKCGASLGPNMPWCPCSPPGKPGGSDTTNVVIDCGCPLSYSCNSTYCPRLQRRYTLGVQP